MPLSALRSAVVGPHGGGGHADDGADRLALAVLGNDERQQMAQQLARRLDVLLRAFLDQALFERAAQVEHRPVLDGLPADQKVALEHLASDQIRGPADEAVDDKLLAV